MSTQDRRTGEVGWRLTRRGWFVVGVLWSFTFWIGLATANYGLNGWSQ
jgi:hypothetical protein